MWRSEHYEHAEIINGDRTLIQKEQEHYNSYGISCCVSYVIKKQYQKLDVT